MKRFYVSPWLLLATAALVTALTGNLNGAALFAFGLSALALAGRQPARQTSLAFQC